MRALALFVVLLVLAPAASALLAPPAIKPAAALATGLPDPRDGDVLMLMAQQAGLHPRRLDVPTPAADDSIPDAIARFAIRVGRPLPAVELAAFDALDPRVARPVLTLLVAMEEAWNVRDAALGADDPFVPVDPKLQPALTPEQTEELVSAAILLSDTLDSVVIPQLQSLAGLPVWPPIAIADPVGIVRIGSAGDDYDTLRRMLTIDGTGNDVYHNIIAGATRPDIDPLTVETAVALALDLSGDDEYALGASPQGTFGDAFNGAAAFYDLAGDDEYDCYGSCLGSATDGVAVFRDVAGNDHYIAGLEALGSRGISLAREDAGDDEYRVGALAMGVNEESGLSLFWDRGGNDDYLSFYGDIALFGWATGTSYGWFVDDGQGINSYWNILNNVPYGRGRCDGCIWSDGEVAGTLGGRGNDGSGGLSHLFAYQVYGN